MKKAWRFVRTMLCCTAWLASTVYGAEARNLIVNGGFEEGAAAGMVKAWSFYASDGEARAAVVNDAVRTGDGALMLMANGGAGRFSGAVQAVDVVPGERYDVEAFVHACGTNLLEGTVYGQLVVEWKAEDGTEVGRAWSEPWDQSLSLTAWRHVRLVNQEAPEGAVKAVCGIHLFDGAKSSRGAVVVDDISFVPTDAGAGKHAGVKGGR